MTKCEPIEIGFLGRILRPTFRGPYLEQRNIRIEVISYEPGRVHI